MGKNTELTIRPNLQLAEEQIFKLFDQEYDSDEEEVNEDFDSEESSKKARDFFRMDEDTFARFREVMSMAKIAYEAESPTMRNAYGIAAAIQVFKDCGASKADVLRMVQKSKHLH